MKSSELKKQIFFTLSIIGAILLLLFVIQAVAPPMRGYVVALLSDKMMNMDAVAGETFDNLVRLAKIMLWMSLIVIIVRFLNALLFSAAFRQERGSQASSLLRNVFSITIYLVSFFVIFKSQYPGVDLAALFTTSAILGVILGLALQDTLGNLFAGLSLQADQPFQVGDVVTIPNKGAGVLESVTWRGVKIRTFQNKLLVISNSILGKESIEVAPRDNLNARIVHFSTLSSESPTRTIHVVREAVREAENVSAKLKPIVRIRDFTDHGIDWEIKYWLENYAKYNDTDALIRQRIWYAFLREKINFASPSQTLYLKRRQQKPKKEDEISKVFERLSAIEIFEPLSDEETMQLA
ncbi:MAG: mechanosensitive ion channel domain-containing protein, partial [Pyrinomonadaceae bacterium]